jgi:hypothetical protein
MNKIEKLLDIVNFNIRRSATFRYIKFNNLDYNNNLNIIKSNKVKCGKLYCNISMENRDGIKCKTLTIYYKHNSISKSKYFNKLCIDNSIVKNGVILCRFGFDLSIPITNSSIIDKVYPLIIEEFIFCNIPTLTNIKMKDLCPVNNIKDVLIIEQDLLEQEYNTNGKA